MLIWLIIKSLRATAQTPHDAPRPRLHLSCFLPFGEEHADGDQQGSCDRHPGYPFTEDDVGEQHGEEGLGVDEVHGPHRAQDCHYLVPDEEADQRCYQSKVDQVSVNLWA